MVWHLLIQGTVLCLTPIVQEPKRYGLQRCIPQVQPAPVWEEAAIFNNRAVLHN